MSSKIKITVGASSSSSSKNSAAARSQIAPSSAIGSTIKQSDFGTLGNLKLADICTTMYGKKGKKRKHKEETDENDPSTSAVKKNIVNINNIEGLRPIAKTTGPRVEFVDGKMVIKESSLEIGQDSMFGDDNYVYEEIEEAGNQTSTTYNSFRQKSASVKWGLEETYLFYQVLRQCGTNFSLMQTFFPSRTRLALKKKFKREEKNHPELVHLSLTTSLPLDLTMFVQSTDIKTAHNNENS